jgi:hypothetical protein
LCNKTKVYIFNGPPRSGKDTLAALLTEHCGATQRSFKDELFKATANLLGISLEEFLEGYDMTFHEVLNSDIEVPVAEDYIDLDSWYKDYPIYAVNGITMSKRQALIHTSEKVLKPSFGKAVLGEMTLRNLDFGKTNVISDGGFVEELEPIVESDDIYEVVVIQLSRDGCTFEGDSRDWLYTPDHKMHWYTKLSYVQVENNGELEETFKDLCNKLSV